MAAGRPVICLNTAGPGLIVADDTGIKVAPASPQAVVDDMATAMSTLANDAALRQKLGEAGRKRVSEQFSWDKKGEALANMYHTLIKNGAQ